MLWKIISLGKGVVDIAQASVAALDNDLYFNVMERNIQWVDRFKEVHQSHERVFLAGGLAHFVFNPFDDLMKDSTGSDIIVVSDPFNVIDFLKIRGYTVKRVVCKK